MSLAAMVSLATQAAVAQTAGLPPDEEGATARLAASPRRSEWVEVKAGEDKIRSWVAFPDGAGRAPVVIVIQEIFGLTDWIRSIADQLAADGFVAIAPDLLSGKGPGGGGSESVDRQGAVALVRTLDLAEVMRRLDAVAKYATGRPEATAKYATVGFCWGGGTSFDYAAHQPNLGAAVVYYGRSTPTESLPAVKAAVLGLYGGNDSRVNATIPPAEAELERLGRSFEKEIYEGAGHGFLRQQSGQEGANRRATEQAWPRTVSFLRQQLK
jgi:carboxymethylenebutenolidase